MLKLYEIQKVRHKPARGDEADYWIVKNPDGRICNDYYHKTEKEAKRHLANIVAHCVDQKEWKYYNLEDINENTGD